MGTQSINLGYYYHVPVRSSESGVLTLGAQGRFIDSLAGSCRQVTCFLHLPGTRDHYQYDYQIKSPNVRFIILGIKGSAPARTFFPYGCLNSVSQHLQGLDALLIRGPSPLLPPLCRHARKSGILPVLFIVGNYVDGIPELRQPFLRKQAIGAYLRIYNSLQKREIASCMTFVNSRKLYDEFIGLGGKVVETRTTTLDEQDFWRREDTCGRGIIRLLYTGRYDLAKGIKLIIKSLYELVAKGHRCQLDLAGWDPSGGGTLSELMEYAANLGVATLITDHGFKPVGEELWSIYRSSDIFINASQASEGFPRTIWEAMANSVPIVATNVGSIRAYAGDAVELVAPRNQSALTAGIEGLILNRDLRKQRIRNGFDLAKGNILSERAREIVEAISEYLASVKTGKGK